MNGLRVRTYSRQPGKIDILSQQHQVYKTSFTLANSRVFIFILTYERVLLCVLVRWRHDDESSAVLQLAYCLFVIVVERV